MKNKLLLLTLLLLVTSFSGSAQKLINGAITWDEDVSFEILSIQGQDLGEFTGRQLTAQDLASGHYILVPLRDNSKVTRFTVGTSHNGQNQIIGIRKTRLRRVDDISITTVPTKPDRDSVQSGILDLGEMQIDLSQQQQTNRSSGGATNEVFEDTWFDFSDLRENPVEQRARINHILSMRPSLKEAVLEIMSYVAHISPAGGATSCPDIECDWNEYPSFSDRDATHTRLVNNELAFLCGDISAWNDVVVHDELGGQHNVFIMEIHQGPNMDNGPLITNEDYGHTVNIVGLPDGDTVRSYMIDVLHGTYYTDVNGDWMETREMYRLLSEEKLDSIIPVSIYFARPHLFSDNLPAGLEQYGVTDIESYANVIDSVMGPDSTYRALYGIPDSISTVNGTCSNKILEWRTASRWHEYINTGYWDVAYYYGLPSPWYLPLVVSGYGFNHTPSPEEEMWAEQEYNLVGQYGWIDQ
jgi:hypothetical protein